MNKFAQSLVAENFLILFSSLTSRSTALSVHALILSRTSISSHHIQLENNYFTFREDNIEANRFKATNIEKVESSVIRFRDIAARSNSAASLAEQMEET